jgi:hypothetical protein
MQNSDFTTGGLAGLLLQAYRNRAGGRPTASEPMLY